MYKSKGRQLKTKETLQKYPDPSIRPGTSSFPELRQTLARDQRQLAGSKPSSAAYTKDAAKGAKTPTTASKGKIAPRWV